MTDNTQLSIFAHFEDPSAEVKTIIEKLTAAYNAATESDRAEVNKLIERAKAGKRDSTVVKFTPGMAAILFVEHNRKIASGRRVRPPNMPSRSPMASGSSPTKASAFWNPVILEMASIALLVLPSPVRPIEMTVGFGMKFAAIIAIDTGKTRQASDFLGIGNQVPIQA